MPSFNRLSSLLPDCVPPPLKLQQMLIAGFWTNQEFQPVDSWHVFIYVMHLSQLKLIFVLTYTF